MPKTINNVAVCGFFMSMLDFPRATSKRYTLGLSTCVRIWPPRSTALCSASVISHSKSCWNPWRVASTPAGG